MPFSTSYSLLQLNQRQFDFNLQFEQLLFSIVPSSLFIVTALWRTLVQVRKPIVVNAPTLQIIKLGAIIAYAGFALSILILDAVGSLHVTQMAIAASVLRLVAALVMVALSAVDHSRSPRPSILLTSYLFLTILLDAAQARTLFLSSDSKTEFTYSGIFTAMLALKASILLLEAQHKSKWIIWSEKEHSPEEMSGIFSLGVYLWLNKLFLAGYKGVLAIEDLYPLDHTLNPTTLHDQFSRKVNYSKMKGDKFGLVKVLVRTLKVPLLLPIPPRLALLGFTFSQPFFIESLLDYLSQPKLDAKKGYGLIGASFLIYFGMAISMAFTWYFHHRLRIMIRSILVPAIYIKATEARIGIRDNSAALTLMSTDMERIRMGFRTLHELWAGLLQVALASWMLYNRLGVVFVAPMGVVIVCFVGLGLVITSTGSSQRAWMSGVQKRVGLTATVIADMKNLKISGLAATVSDFVQKLRVDELEAGSKYRRIFILSAIMGFTPLLIGPPLAFAFVHRTLDNSTVFTSLAFLTLLTVPLSQVFQGVPDVVSGLACLGRIQAFLESETRHDARQVLIDTVPSTEKNHTNSGTSIEVAMDIKNGNFGWEVGKFVLRDVNIRVSKSSLTMVIGPVASGKSTLCKALLGEIPFSGGTVNMGARFAHVGYCDQTAFLSNGTIKDNIVGFCPLDDARYAEVIQATALGIDLATLPQGDRTNVGSDGITLSGGQKQRVALARALYLQSDLLVLDDVFSGLDADTEKEVFRQVFGLDGLLRRRLSTVLLCTHSVRHLSAADHIIALGDGTVAEQGSFDELLANNGYLQRLGLKGSSYSDTSSEETAADTSAVEQRLQVPYSTTQNLSPPVPATAGSRQIGDRAVYKHYIMSMGLLLATCSGFFATLWGFFMNFPTVWLTFWTDDVNSKRPAHSHAYYAGIYALLQVCAVVSLLLLGVAIYIFSVKKAGANLHRNALRTLIRAPLRFFTKTDTGVVTNLFSQDLNLIDTELSEALINTLVTLSQAVGQVAVMLTSSPYLAVSYPFLGGLLYTVQRFYLRTSRQLRLLDLEAKSPLYTHFIDTVKGITTLRAFGFLPDDIQKNARLIGSSQRPSYLLLMVQEWLNLVLGLVVMIMAVAVTTLTVRLHSKSGFAGASLYSLLTLGENLSGIVIYWTKLETSLGAISRLKSFSDTVKPEDTDEEDIVPPQEWPQRGIVKLAGVSASYDAEDYTEDKAKLALRNIHLSINGGEKIAICGRTGSGKSSLVALLLKLLDPTTDTAENAVIDDLPLHRINRPALRQRIIAVPQQAVFLPDGSTFRANLDPSNAATLEECEAALVAVDLWKFVQTRGGLDASMSAGTFSAGQRQLMSLGRALLRRTIQARTQEPDGNSNSSGGILLLDEVSSSVDYETERIMQEIIKVEFRSYTVIAVSHRLDMIMDFDRVVVMDTGEIVEEGNPVMLAGKVGTKFGDLVRAGVR